MSQMSITSFFKKTPKKDDEDKVQSLNNENSHIKSESNGELSPTSTEKVKKSSKRRRLDSSGSESQVQLSKSPAQTSPIKAEKKIKRQRIESSGSESEPPKSPEQQAVLKSEQIESPDSKEPQVTENTPPSINKKSKNAKKGKTFSSGSESESPNSPEQQAVVKLEQIESPDSKEPQVTENTPPSEKKKRKNANKEKSPSKSEKVTASQETSPVIEKNNKEDKSRNISSFFQKKESGVNVKKENGEVGDEDNGKVAETEYNPAKSKYHPVKDACWSKGEEVPYLALAKTLEAIEGTSARLKMVEILSNYFRSVIALTPEDLLPSIYLCLNQLAPAYHSLELGIAETYLMKAVGQCTGRTLAQVRSAARAAGDLGLVAERARATQRTMRAPPPLRVRTLFQALKDIAHMTGQASVNKKIAKIQSLYVACRHSEARYLIRSLEGKLRIGLAEQSVLQALAVATATTPPAPSTDVTLDASAGLAPDQFKAIVDEHALIIKTTYCECPDYGRVVGALLAHGVRELPRHCALRPGVPLKPMLAHPARGVRDLFDRFEQEQFTCEWKYDGERAQLHVPGDARPDLARAAIFSRNQEDNTSKYPDVAERLPALLGPDVASCVLDCEVVAYDPAAGQILPFQVLSTRKRKGAAQSEIKVQVCVYVFDLLYLNGRALVREPLDARRALLREHFREVPGQWQFAVSKDCSSEEEVQQFLEEAVRGSCEGLMVKTLRGARARYDIARRSHNWLKLKKDYLEGAGDTVDAVVVGAYHGRGKRAGVYGGFLLACYDASSDHYQALCKLGTGFSEDQLRELSEDLRQHVIEAPRAYYSYDASHAPDAWFAAARVWEVRCADLSLSPAHRAAIGLVDPDKGISLRFPRFVRARDDKAPEQATSAQQIAAMYLAQDQVKNQAPKNTNYDEFY